MAVVKRGLFFVILLILVASVYSATTLDLSLNSNKVGTNSVFDGFLDFNFTETLPIDSFLVFYMGNLMQEISLEDALSTAGLLDNPNLEIINETYSASDGGLSISITSPGIDSGFDLSGSVLNPRQPGDVEVTGATLKIKAINTVAQSPSIHIGNQKVYTYRGNERQSAQLNRNYLGTFSVNGLGVEFVSGNVYCQKINITASGKYLLKTIIKKHTDASDINLTLSDEVIAFPECTEISPCCTIRNSLISTGFSEKSCWLEKNIPEDKEQYICIFPTVQDIEGDLFSIRATNSQPTVNGFISGIQAEWNFYLYGDYMMYENNLVSDNTDIVRISHNYLNDYMLGFSGCKNNCLIIPLNISTNNNAELQLSDLSLSYIVGGFTPVTENEFKSIDILPKSISYDGIIHLDLSFLENLKSPNQTGNYTFYTSFNGVNSDQLSFNIVHGPVAVIKYGPFNPGINEVVTFDASSTIPAENRSIVLYSWELGDGNVKTGTTITHSYNKTGNYRVKLKVRDSEGIAGFNSLFVRVSNVSFGVLDLINKTKASINTFKSSFETSSEKAKNTAELLGVTQSLDDFQIELDNLLLEYNNIELNSSITNTQKNILFAPIKERIEEISRQVPVALTVDSSTFNGGITNVNQIPNCCEFTTEILKNKLFASQKNIDINAEAIIVNIEYIEGNSETFMIIKKDIMGAGLKIYEILPFGLQIREVFNEINFTVPSPNVYSFAPTNKLVYKVESTNLAQALQTRTIILPSDLESTEVEVLEDVLIESECGNSICEADEDENICAADCKPVNTKLYLVILLIALVVCIIIYFAIFFRGGLLKRIIKPKDSSWMFKNEKDYLAVKRFVMEALNKGLNREKIESALRNKEWKDNQIKSIFEDIEKEKKSNNVTKR